MSEQVSQSVFETASLMRPLTKQEQHALTAFEQLNADLMGPRVWQMSEAQFAAFMAKAGEQGLYTNLN